MVSNAFDNSMDITATISLLLRQCLQSSVSLINDVLQLQLYVDAYTVYAEMKSNNMLLQNLLTWKDKSILKIVI